MHENHNLFLLLIEINRNQ